MNKKNAKEIAYNISNDGLLVMFKKAKERLVKELMHKSPIKLTISDAEKAAEKVSELQDLNEKIDDTQLIVEYLAKVEKIFHNATWDFKNVIQLHFSEKS